MFLYSTEACHACPTSQRARRRFRSRGTVRRAARRVRRRRSPRTVAARAGHAIARDAVAAHYRDQRIARRPVRPLHQSLPGLRARLRLLLRAAQPQLPGPIARAGFRNPDLLQARRGRTACRSVGKGLVRVQADHDRRQHRPLPARGANHARHARAARDVRRTLASGQHYHQGHADHPGPRPARRTRSAQTVLGGDQPSDHEAGPEARHGTPGAVGRCAAENHATACRRRCAGQRSRCARDPGAQ